MSEKITVSRTIEREITACRECPWFLVGQDFGECELMDKIIGWNTIDSDCPFKHQRG